MTGNREVFAISDLHLPGLAGWAMNGSTPKDPWATLTRNWKSQIPEDAIVLLPGDLCHHPDPGHARSAYEIIDALPGRTKVIVPGNHDWETASTPSTMKAVAGGHRTIIPLLGTATRICDHDGPALVVAGTCGAWPTMNGGGKLAPCYKRETRRLRSALEHAGTLAQHGDSIAVMTHYPVRSWKNVPTRMSRMIEESGAGLAVYGHIHNKDRWRKAWQAQSGPTSYRLVAADYLMLRPRHVATMGRRGLRVH